MAGPYVTNEIKDAAGTEVEYALLSTNGSKSILKKVGESPAYSDRLTLSHQETGTGLAKRRRSLVRFDLYAAGQVDATVPAGASAYLVLDIPIGNQTSNALVLGALARLGSFVFTLSGNTTFLRDGTGTGAVVLLDGSV
jgi:hypothetical protein